MYCSQVGDDWQLCRTKAKWGKWWSLSNNVVPSIMERAVTMICHHDIGILWDHLLTWANPAFGGNFLFVQDTVTLYIACETTAFLEQPNIEVMDWPVRIALSMCGIKCLSGWEAWKTHLPVLLIYGRQSAKHGVQWAWEDSRSWWTACFVMYALSWGRLSIKMSSYQYRDPHVEDTTVSRPSYL